MINGSECGQLSKVRVEVETSPIAAETLGMRQLVEAHVGFVFRSLRRLGVPDHALDDAVQKVWIVAAGKTEGVRAESARSFLIAIALRVASDVRRGERRRMQVADDEAIAAATDGAPLPDEKLDRKRARALLDRILDLMDDDLRAVFVLFELEQATMVEIAEALSIPAGTVASRLRRAREVFERELRKRRGAR